MSKKHWLYRVMSEQTAKEALKNHKDGVITLLLKHPIAWNPSVDACTEYARFRKYGVKCTYELKSTKSTECGISDSREGTIAPYPTTKSIPDKLDRSKSVQQAVVRMFNFVDPRIRAICFSHFFGTEEDLLGVIGNARASYESSLGKNISHYFYGEVEAVLSAICNLSDLPTQPCLKLAPVFYTSPDRPPIGRLPQFPWGNALDRCADFQALCSRDGLRPHGYSDPLARHVLNAASLFLLKLADPYAIEREVRLFMFSPDFYGQADLTQWDRGFHACKIELSDALTLGAF